MGVSIENHQKVVLDGESCSCLFPIFSTYVNNNLCLVCNNQQFEELQSRHDSQVQQCSDLTCKLDVTQVNCLPFIPSSCLQLVCKFLLWKVLAETIEPNKQIASIHWRTIKTIPIYSEGAGFHHLWTKKSWYSYLDVGFEVLWNLVLILKSDIHRKCAGSPSMCFTGRLGEINSRECFLISKNW